MQQPVNILRPRLGWLYTYPRTDPRGADDVIGGTDEEYRDASLLAEHGGGGEPEAGAEAAPLLYRGCTPQQQLIPKRPALLLVALHLRPVRQLHVRPSVSLSEPHVRHVEEEREKVEETGEQVGPAHYTGDSLCVDGVGGEQEGR